MGPWAFLDAGLPPFLTWSLLVKYWAILFKKGYFVEKCTAWVPKNFKID